MWRKLTFGVKFHIQSCKRVNLKEHEETGTRRRLQVRGLLSGTWLFPLKRQGFLSFCKLSYARERSVTWWAYTKRESASLSRSSKVSAFQATLSFGCAALMT